jgi:RNA polymerase-interacting CarD/CdnL/TRCF family regulator
MGNIKIGDLVMHPTNGICRVTGIKKDDMSVGEKMYVLKPQKISQGEWSILVQCRKAAQVGIRVLLSVKEIESILKIMEAGPENIDVSDNDKNALKAIFRGGDPYKTAAAIRDLEKSDDMIITREIKPFLIVVKENLANEIAHIKKISKPQANNLIANRLKKNIKNQ